MTVTEQVLKMLIENIMIGYKIPIILFSLEEADELVDYLKNFIPVIYVTLKLNPKVRNVKVLFLNSVI